MKGFLHFWHWGESLFQYYFSKTKIILQLWTDDSSDQNEVKNDAENKEKNNAEINEAENKVKLWVRNPDLGNLIPGWILCHMFSVLVVILPGAFSKIGAQVFNLETDDAISIGKKHAFKK